MPNEQKIIQLLSELTRLTSKGAITWSIVDAPDSLAHATNDVYPLYFQTTFKEQAIGLAQRRYQDYDGDRDRIYWTEEIVLVFLDRHKRVIWEARSPVSAMYNLFESVREKVADVDGILSNLLGESDGH